MNTSHVTIRQLPILGSTRWPVVLAFGGVSGRIASRLDRKSCSPSGFIFHDATTFALP